MSLYYEAMEDCEIIDKTTRSDGRGGKIDVWTKGADFRAAIVYDSSMEARRAEAQGVTALYTITTEKTMNLQYHDVFMRKSDGKIFRVTSDGDDRRTPASAGLNMRQVSAEEWEVEVSYGNG